MIRLTRVGIVSRPAQPEVALLLKYPCRTRVIATAVFGAVSSYACTPTRRHALGVDLPEQLSVPLVGAAAAVAAVDAVELDPTLRRWFDVSFNVAVVV